MNMKRRDFTGTVLAGVVGAMGSGMAQEQKGGERIDTHQHLWDLDLLSPAWLKRGEAPLGLRYWEEEYERAIGKTPFKAVFMEIDMGWQKADLEADVILKLCRGASSRTRAAILGGDPARLEFGDFMERHGRDPRVRGFRRVLHSDETPKGYGLGSTFLKHVRRVGELGKTFDLCMRPTELADAAQMAREWEWGREGVRPEVTSELEEACARGDGVEPSDRGVVEVAQRVLQDLWGDRTFPGGGVGDVGHRAGG